MKKEIDFTIPLIGFIILIAALCSCEKVTNDNQHSCKWELCPYEGITKAEYNQAVIDYSECEEGSDCFNIDILHLKYPSAEYDQLDSMLFSKMK